MCIGIYIYVYIGIYKGYVQEDLDYQNDSYSCGFYPILLREEAEGLGQSGQKKKCSTK